MIFPDRVFGSSGTSMIWRGLQIGPSVLATWSRSSLTSASPGSTPPLRMTNATIACPVVGSVAPTTAASATFAWLTSADSTSVVEMLWPDTSITSSTRPSSHRSPSSSFFAPSPAKYTHSSPLPAPAPAPTHAARLGGLEAQQANQLRR